MKISDDHLLSMLKIMNGFIRDATPLERMMPILLASWIMQSLPVTNLKLRWQVDPNGLVDDALAAIPVMRTILQTLCERCSESDAPEKVRAQAEVLRKTPLYQRVMDAAPSGDLRKAVLTEFLFASINGFGGLPQ